MSIDYSKFAFPKPACKVKTKTQIKKKSKKLAKKERERFSILQDDKNKCFLCHRSNIKTDKHEAFGGRNRQISMRYGLVYYLCRKCHSEAEINIETKNYLKEYARKIFIKNYSEEKFTEEFK